MNCPSTPLPFRWAKKIYFIHTDDIVCIKADGNESYLILATGQKQPCELSLKELETVLGEFGHLRTHKSWIVNPIWIDSIAVTEREIVFKPLEHLNWSKHKTVPTISRSRARLLGRPKKA